MSKEAKSISYEMNCCDTIEDKDTKTQESIECVDKNEDTRKKNVILVVR